MPKGYPNPRGAICWDTGCERTGPLRRGLCSLHYARGRRVDRPRTRRVIVGPPAARFWPKVVWTADNHWMWTGARSKTGHGRFLVDGKNRPAYRWAYEHLVGPIPAGLHLDHLCMTPACVNPLHLEPVTPGENVRRAHAARRAARRAAVSA